MMAMHTSFYISLAIVILPKASGIRFLKKRTFYDEAILGLLFLLIQPERIKRGKIFHDAVSDIL